MNNVDFITASNIAVLILSFIGGLAVSFFFRSKGIRGCIMYIASAVVIIIIIISLTKGYNRFLENITYNLTEYIYYNSLGIIGFVIGLLVGIKIRNK